MLPDFHFLLRAAVFQPLNPFFAALDLGRSRRVLLLQLLDLAALVEQRGDSPRTPQRYYTVDCNQAEHHGVAGAAADRAEAQTMGKGLNQGFQYVYSLDRE